MKFGTSVLIGLLVVLALFSDLAGNAFAAPFKNVPHQYFRMKKGAGHFSRKFHAPKKLHDSKSKFRSPISGNMIYGKPAKHK